MVWMPYWRRRLLCVFATPLSLPFLLELLFPHWTRQGNYSFGLMPHLRSTDSRNVVPDTRQMSGSCACFWITAHGEVRQGHWFETTSSCWISPAFSELVIGDLGETQHWVSSSLEDVVRLENAGDDARHAVKLYAACWWWHVAPHLRIWIIKRNTRLERTATTSFRIWRNRSRDL